MTGERSHAKQSEVAEGCEFVVCESSSDGAREVQVLWRVEKVYMSLMMPIQGLGHYAVPIYRRPRL